jgi:RHS repeat-associated protein
LYREVRNTSVLATTATFNAADQLTRQVTTGTLGSHTATVTTNNTFDANGNLTTAATTKTSSDSNLLTGLLGGVLGSLFGLGGNGQPQTSSYSYNFNNQPTQVSGVDPTSSPADPQSEQTLTSTFGYDGLGRATRHAIAEPHHTNRLLQLDVKLGLTTSVATAGAHVGVNVNGQPCSDPQDNSATCRTSLTPFAGHPTDVTYDGLTPIAWSDTTSTRTINTLYGPQGLDQQTDSRYGTSYFHLDLLGSPRTLTNTTGATIAAGAYDDWGNPQPNPGEHQTGGLLTGAINLATGLLGGLLGTAPRPPFASTGSATPVGYTSQTADPAQGLLHFHARSYAPGCGTWLQSDPWGGLLHRPTSLNKYDYTENNPATHTDLLGYMFPSDAGPSYQGPATRYTAPTPTGPTSTYLQQTPCGSYDCNPGAIACTGQCASQTPCAQYACGGNYAPPTDGSYNTTGTQGCPSCNPAGWTTPTSQQNPASHSRHYNQGVHDFLHKTSIATGLIGTVAGGAAILCTAGVITIECDIVAAPVAMFAGVVSSTTDLVDMFFTGNVNWTYAVLDVTAIASGGVSKLITNLPAEIKESIELGKGAWDVLSGTVSFFGGLFG